MYCKPDIDIFASSINYQTGQCASWHPDRNAIAIDAFSASWSELDPCEFPPFISKSQAGAVFEDHDYTMVETQLWFPMTV